MLKNKRKAERTLKVATSKRSAKKERFQLKVPKKDPAIDARRRLSWENVLGNCALINEVGSSGDRALVKYYPAYLSGNDRVKLYDQLESFRSSMSQDEVLMRGVRVLTPRLAIAFGESGTTYSYSGMTRTAVGWERCPLLHELKARLEADVGQVFNYALVNRYADGKDYIGWHSDAESDMVSPSWIASVTVGENRDFQFRARLPHGKVGPIMTLSPIHSGSLLLMNMGTQRLFKHFLPKRANVDGVRFSVTFRQMKTSL